MNDTRRQIIKLIEPYMDKTLCEGCLISWFMTFWHYDITAVLKYIRQYKDFDICLSDDGDTWAIERVKWVMEFMWTFPNKPLHLYTKEEEKRLLTLL